MSVISVHTPATELTSVVSDLSAQLVAAQSDPSLVMLFCGHELDGAAVASGLVGRVPGAKVIACSSAGEFTERSRSRQGAAAVALPRTQVPRVATAVVDPAAGAGVGPAVAAAAEELERQLGTELRGLDPTRYVGLVLIDGLNGLDEEINQALGRVAPFLSFVGGSAGDDLQFSETWVATERTRLTRGAVLAVMELTVPYTVLKTCSFAPTDQSFVVTRADPAERMVYELDGRDVVEVYTEAVRALPGGPAANLDTTLFMRHPLGVMIDGQPWIRCPQRVVPGGGLKLYCQLPEDTKVHLMEPTDLIADTRAAVERARTELGGQLTGGVLFNCAFRRLVLDAENTHEEFLKIFEGVPMAGLHTYGESWLGHMNQTCTGLLLG